MRLCCVKALSLSARTGRVKTVHEGEVLLHHQGRQVVRLPQSCFACDYMAILEGHGSRTSTRAGKNVGCAHKAGPENVGTTPAG